ncbi:MAG: MlaD family protein [Alphaproteobacteria bacterium]
MGKSLVETVMGAVVLAIAGFFLVFAYTSSDLKPVAGYQVTAKFGSVGSLTEGSDVRIGGVKVGSVIRQSIDPKDYRAVVTMTILSTISCPTTRWRW